MSPDPLPAPAGVARQGGSAAPAPGESCRACASPLGADELSCPRCGTPRPEAPRCPHCGAIADVRSDAEVRFACHTCGGARVKVRKSGWSAPLAATDALRQVEAARSSRRLWRIGGAFAGVGAAGVLLLALLIQLLVGFSLVGSVLAVLLALPMLLLAVASVARNRARTADLGRHLDEAWHAVAEDLAHQSKTALSSAELARMLPLPERDVEQLLATLAVDESLESNVTADGQIAFSGLRIEPAGPGGATAPAAGEAASAPTVLQAAALDTEPEAGQAAEPARRSPGG